jgi:methylglutaconyl-CoA hydratase
MTNNDTVLLTRDARGIATLMLNRPERRNAFDAEVITTLHAAIDNIARNAAIRAVILTGAGSAFCAGMDLDHMRRQGAQSTDANTRDARAFADCLHALDRLEKPVIARVNGGAYGGGVGLIACADIAIAADTAKLAFTEVRMGIVPAVISPYVVAAIGTRHARRWFLSGGVLDAPTAKHVGLLHEVVPAAELDTAVEQEVSLLLQGGPTALAAAKQLVRDVSVSFPTSGEKTGVYTAELLARLRASPEGQEGLAAFNEKRRPSWHR